MTEKSLNSSIKQPLGVSPNTILYGAIPTEHTLLADIDTIPSTTAPRTIRDYVDTLMARPGRIISAAISSQQRGNSENLQRRYAHYSRAPILNRRRNIHGAPQVMVNIMGGNNHQVCHQTQSYMVMLYPRSIHSKLKLTVDHPQRPRELYGTMLIHW